MITCLDCVWCSEDEHEILWCSHPNRATFPEPDEGDDATSCEGFNKGHCLTPPNPRDCIGFNSFTGIPPMP